MTKRLLLVILPLLLLVNTVMAGFKPLTSPIKSYHLQPGISPDDYLPNTIILKVLPEYRSNCTENAINIPSLQHVFGEIGMTEIHKMFVNDQPPATEFNERGEKMVDLSLIYILEYKEQLNLIKAINLLLRSGVLLYAEPKFIPKLFLTPNDPQISTQYFLSNIQAYAAWDINQGDTNVVVGIVDTGTDTDHPDLAPNLKHNYADPINGIDDDNDGFTDNFSGWDLGESDNNTQVGNCGVCSHGSHVSGCAAAVTNNGIGVSSPGFKCRFLPVKIADGSGKLTAAYEGIRYAADHGCQIINCSWGGTGGGFSNQEIINYASINKNALVIAAAGNNDTTQFFYTAAFENVLAIASTGMSDVKSGFSNFGSYIDVCAPGSGIYSTYFDNTYSYQSGTSMAAPVAAGCAAIVKSYFPSYSSKQIGEQLRITADNIYSIPGNIPFAGQLGTGRINLYRALTVATPSVRMENILIVDHNDDILLPTDTMRISGDIIDYLAATTNLNVTLTCSSPYVTILDGNTSVGALATLAISNNNADPFIVKISPVAPQNTVIQFKLQFVDGAYSDFQLFDVTVNTDYINITINDVATTNTSKGRLCYNSLGQADGLGFDYLDNGTLTYEAGLMVGIPGNQVSDNVRGTGTITDDDFIPVNTIQKNEPAIWSDFDTYGTFDDQIALIPLGLSVSYRSMSWSQVPFSKFHIFEYTLFNTSANSLAALYAGIFSDWDIGDPAKNKANEDPSLKMGYVYSTAVGGYYAGVKLLSNGGFKHYALDNITGGGGALDISNGYSDANKYTTLSTNRATAGGTASSGNDVIDIVSTGPFNLLSGDSVVVAFAVFAGDDLADIQNSAQQAQIKYDLLTSIHENQSAQLISANPYPNPATDKVILPFYLKQSASVKLTVYDVTGKIVINRLPVNVSAGEQQFELSLKGLSNGLYHYRLNSNIGQSSGIIQKL